jgi:hypothetical protein
MDSDTIRKQLDEVKTALKRNEDEHRVLVSLMQGYEGWLRLNPGAAVQLTLTTERVQAQGGISFRGAVLRVLKEARGEPLNVREILVRAQGLGAVTGAKNPLGAVDLVAYSLAKNHSVEKVGPRTWRYGEPAPKE